MQNLFDLAAPIAPAPAHTAGAVIYERFQSEPDTLAIAVVDGEGRPCGIVERNEFFLKMAAEYGRALFAKRPISVLMNPSPLVFEGETPISDFFGGVMVERPSELLHGFVVVQRGRYVGVCSAIDVLRAASHAQQERAAEMARLAEHLEGARMEAQLALDAKSRFLAVMSHEIRTPLNGVLAVADILTRKLAGHELQPLAETISGSGESLLRLLNDVLDLSRVDAGHLELDEAPVALHTLLDDLSALWSARAAEDGLAFEVSYDGDPDLWCLADATRLKQVFSNLIGNAVKFTDAGQVQLRLKAAREDVYVRLVAEVADSGAGLEEDKIQAMFEPFVQSAEGRARGGTGLGLAISRQLVEKMGGEMFARRNPVRGLTVGFEAHFYHVQGDAPASAEASTLDAGRALHVLIVDDNATNRMVAETLCQMFGCTSQSVCDGAEALKATLAGAFDLILMDVKMPVMDGVAATRAIRQSPGAAAETPILMLTANADPWDAASYLANGADGVVEKPIKPELLLAEMERALAAREMARAA